MKQVLVIASLFTSALVLGACSSTPLTPSGEGRAATASEALGQSVLPPGSSFKAEHSLIMGAGEQWVGRVVAEVGRDTDAAYRFFLETYPTQGWTLISSVRGKTSLIVLTKQDRTATVELAEASLLSPAVATLTVAPRNAQTVAPKKP